MVAGSDWVSGGENELAALASELVSGKDGLVEKEWVVDIVSLRAVALLDQAWVCDVRLVVVRVLGSGSTARECHLEADTINTVGIHVLLVWELVAVEGCLWGLGVVEAVDTNSTLLEEELIGRGGWPEAELLVGEWAGEVADSRVARNHLEAFREWLEVIKVEQVVGKHATNVGDHLGSAIIVLEVERWGPVGGHVFGDSARSAVVLLVGTLGKSLIVGGLTEVWKC